MIRFANQDEGKQFIEIKVKNKPEAETVINKVKREYPSLQQVHIVNDDSEVLIEIEDNINYGFSLNELRKLIGFLSAARVICFSVDINEATQRYYG